MGPCLLSGARPAGLKDNTTRTVDYGLLRQSILH